jgi:hypothetical protein
MQPKVKVAVDTLVNHMVYRHPFPGLAWQISHLNSHPVECLQAASISPQSVFNI